MTWHVRPNNDPVIIQGVDITDHVDSSTITRNDEPVVPDEDEDEDA